MTETEAITKPTTKPATNTDRWFTIDGKPLPRTQAFAHLVKRFVRTADGESMSAPDFRAWLTEHGKPGDAPLSKCWSVTTPNGRKVAVVTVKS